MAGRRGNVGAAVTAEGASAAVSLTFRDALLAAISDQDLVTHWLAVRLRSTVCGSIDRLPVEIMTGYLMGLTHIVSNICRQGRLGPPGAGRLTKSAGSGIIIGLL